MLINIITLGCSKNSVDSEVIASKFVSLGHQVCFEEEKASDIVMINTCSFIRDAKKESIEEIFHQIERKKSGLTKKVYVMGCLAQRYQEDLQGSVPEVDGFYNFSELHKLFDIPQFDLLAKSDRILTTPSHYAYMKISEGCDRQCAFCAIPLIRGKQISKPIEQLVEEAQYLVGRGVKEIMLIAQDSTSYGTDLYHQRELDKLLLKLTDVKGLEWIRLHYAYPNNFPYPVLDVMRDYDVFCKYLDMPIQHVSENVLRSMNRPSSPDKMRKLFDTIREKMPNITLRTTLLSGFPTETKADHKELVAFIEEIKFDRMGAFSYSLEEDTPAYPLEDPIKPKEKLKRLEELMSVQEEISYQLNTSKIGSVLKVIVDSEETDYYIGRTEGDSPEVDNSVFITKDSPLETGEFYQVFIERAEPFDLFGHVIHQN